jgi:serine/threonine-protein kinase
MESARGQLGNYRLVAEIARGGMGVIYLALPPPTFVPPPPSSRMSVPPSFRDASTEPKKLVVLKKLKPELAEDEKFRQMFLEEARLGTRLRHRNIVQSYEVDEDRGQIFFVMEYLEGRSLQSVTRLKGARAVSVPTMLRVACDVLAGLHYAHEVNDANGKPLGLVHRDVSTHNVFLTYDGQVKLLDFGVAKAYGRAQVTEAGVLRGRVGCMSPDHLSEAPLDRRADVFAVGVMLREALTGKPVWNDRTDVEILRELMTGKIPPLGQPDGLAPEVRA